MKLRFVLNFAVIALMLMGSVGYVFAGGSGKSSTPLTITSIMEKHGLSEQFPEAVLAEVDAISDQISEDELRNRRDLRERMMITIDGEDTRDFDDAVSVERLANGNVLLGVHIADVGHYVKEGSALDKEAYRRGTSVYLADRVLPMLPRRLSNGICSLNPQVDRLTITCDIEIGPDGEFVGHEIYPSVVCTKERMTYTQVKRILVDKDEELLERYGKIVGDLQLMGELSEILIKKRIRRGSIDFNTPEGRVIVDELGKPTEIKQRPRTVAEKLIEEFMLAANEVVSEHYYKLGVPFLYRVHANPNSQKIHNFNGFLNYFGYAMKENPSSQDFQELLRKIKGAAGEAALSKVMLRSMEKAKYSTVCTGHFSLATQYYSHFTSPIRRYPDLLIHRVMREVIENGSISGDRRKHLQTFLGDAAQQSSRREKIANEVEREASNLKKAEYMMDKVGSQHEGIISGVTKYGFYVQLSNTVEGLVRVQDLPEDHYSFNAEMFSLIGEKHGKVYRIGDAVCIRVKGVDLTQGRINFSLLKEEH